MIFKKFLCRNFGHKMFNVPWDKLPNSCTTVICCIRCGYCQYLVKYEIQDEQKLSWAEEKAQRVAEDFSKSAERERLDKRDMKVLKATDLFTQYMDTCYHQNNCVTIQNALDALEVYKQHLIYGERD